jgi:hypothetical protein
MRIAAILLSVLLGLTGVLTGCSRHKYELPERALEDPDLLQADVTTSEERPDYYVLAWSPLNVSGRQVPDCPYEVLGEVEVLASEVSRLDTWQEDKALATPRTDASVDPRVQRDTDQPTYREERPLTYPKRPESRLLDVLRKKAQALGGDAIIEIVLYHAADTGGMEVTVQNLDLNENPAVERITGAVIRFTQMDCHH